DLIDPVHLIFDWLLDGDDFAIGLVDVVQARVKSARLAGTGRTGNEEDSIRELDQTLEGFLVVAKKPQFGQTEHKARFVEHAHNDAFAVVCRDSRDTKIDRLLFDFDLDTTVLGQTFFSDAHRAGHDLEPADG